MLKTIYYFLPFAQVKSYVQREINVIFRSEPTVFTESDGYENPGCEWIWRAYVLHMYNVHNYVVMYIVHMHITRCT